MTIFQFIINFLAVIFVMPIISIFALVVFVMDLIQRRNNADLS